MLLHFAWTIFTYSTAYLKELSFWKTELGRTLKVFDKQNCNVSANRTKSHKTAKNISEYQSAAIWASFADCKPINILQHC